MRILILNSEYPPVGGGAGNASAYLARALVKQGQTVAVLTARYDDLPHQETRDGVLVRRLPALRKRLDRSSAAEQLSFIFSGAVYTTPFARSWRPDVIIAFFGMPSGAIAWLMRRFFGVPYVVSLRGGDVPGFRPYDFGLYYRLSGPFLRRIWHDAGAVIANSRGLRDLGNAFDAATPIGVIPNGVDASRFTPAGRDWAPGRLLFVGRIVYQKGLDVLLRALGGLRDLEWSLTLAGDGKQRPELEAQASALGIAERIHFTGWLAKDAVAAQYRQANLYVAPSRNEGMPNVVLEAMASGLPVVASEVAGNGELVTPGFNGLLVPPEDAEALQAALRSLLSEPEKMQKMGAASRQRVVESYTWDSAAAQYLEIARELVQG